MSEQQPNIAIIAAMTADRVIGQDGHLPWSLPVDVRLFRELTLGGTLIMGRRTYESLSGPLDRRHNLVISRTLPELPGITVCRSWEEAIQVARKLTKGIWVIGGADIYRTALKETHQLIVSWVEGDYPGDVLFPALWRVDWELLCQTTYQGFIQCRYRRLKHSLSPDEVQAAGPLVTPFPN
jgi:dihydrofolate reductase